MNYIPVDLFKDNINDNDLKLWDYEPSRHLLVKARMLFNGIERIEWREYKYFHFMQNHENYQKSLDSYIYMYSFNINPIHNNNYSGCNFSRISNSQLQIIAQTNNFYINNTTKYPSYDIFILKCYATNYNILVIKNGICGLKYSI